MLKNKIRSIFTLSGFKQIDYAKELGVSPMQLGNKIRNAAYSLTDIVKLADRVNAEVVIRSKDGKDIVVFDISDLDNN